MSKKVVALHFWSPTCAPCKTIKPAIEDLKEEFNTIEWISVNTHADDKGYSSALNVGIVPTIVVLVKDESGTVLSSERHSGTQVAGYYRILRNALRML